MLHPSANRSLLFLACILAAPVYGQDSPCAIREIPINVTDPAGVIVTDLNPATFLAKVHGKPVQVLSVARDSRPRRIVILLDASSSMTIEPIKWAMALRTATELLNAAPASDTFSLIVFTNAVQETVDFTQDRGSILTSLQKIERGKKALPKGTKGSTALWDAISAGATLLGSSTPGDVIYAITDGDDNASEEKPSVIERTLLEKGIRLFGFFFDEGSIEMYPDHPTLIDVGTTLKDTGGVAVVLPRGKYLESEYKLSNEQLALLSRLLQSQFKQIDQFYLLKIALAQDIQKPADLSLGFTPANDRKLRALTLTYVDKISPCNSHSP